jgi:predicted metal-dependent HD superfamily phosphohydrolase
MGWAREYYVLKTTSGDAVALVQRLCSGENITVNFTLWYPEYEGTDREFHSLVGYTLSLSEYTTHRDAFKTLQEVEIVRDAYDHTSLMREVLVRKKDEPNPSKISNTR